MNINRTPSPCTVVPEIGDAAPCYHGAAGTIVYFYQHSADIMLSVDEAHADMFGCHTCWVTA